MARPLWHRRLLSAALIALVTAAGTGPAAPADRRPGSTLKLTAGALGDAVRCSEVEAARSLILLDGNLVARAITSLMDEAIAADLALGAAPDADLWVPAEQLAALYREHSGDDFWVAYVARWRGLGRDRNAGWVRARDAFRRTREHHRRDENELYKQAIEECIRTWRELGDPHGEADCLGERFQYLRHGIEGYEPLLESARAASELYLEAGDARAHASSLMNEALAQDLLGEYQVSLDKLQCARAISASVADHRQRMRALSEIGWKRMRLNQYGPALDAYDDAHQIALQLGARYWESQLLMWKGIVYENLEMFGEANRFYLRALAALEDVGKEPKALIANLGTNYYNLGLYLKSLRFMHRFLGVVKGDRSGEAYAYSIIGRDYEALGDDESAEAAYESACELTRETGARRELVEGLNLLARVQARLGKLAEAERALGEVVAILAELPKTAKSLVELHDVAERYEAIGKREQARELYVRVASEAAKGEVWGELADAHAALAAMAVEVEEPVAAREHIAAALESLARMDDLSFRAHTTLEIAPLQAAIGDVTSALATYRTGLKQYEPFIATTFEGGQAVNWSMVRRSYEGMIVLLQGAPPAGQAPASRDESFRMAQRFHALGLRQLLEQRRRLAPRDAPVELEEREERVLAELSAAQRELAGVADADARRALLERVRRLEDEHELVRAQLGLDGRLEESGLPRAIGLDPAREVLDRSSALLLYFLGEEHAFLWVVTQADSTMLQLPPPTEIEEAVRFYAKGVSSHASRRDTFRAASEALYSMLLEPATPHLEGITRLLVVPDGALHRLPFEALTPPGARSSLIGSYSVGYLPAVSLLVDGDRGERRSEEDRPWEVLLVADPEASPRTAPVQTPAPAMVAYHLTERGYYERGGFELGPLTHARGEVEQLARIFRGWAPTTILTGDRATEEAIKGLDVSRFSILHFATHALWDRTVPMRSAVVLSAGTEAAEDGFLQMREVFNLDLDADLVVLSGCETGRGQLLEGEGVIGLPRAFIAAGARALVVSLWRVDDRSTSLLMSSFYRNLKQGMDKASALRQAKLELMRIEDGRYAAPYYWAPFVLIGERAAVPAPGG